MTILDSAKKRYATKAFDPERPLTQTQIAHIKSILRLSPSSINYQPWHFLIVTSQSGKQQVAKACTGAMAYNANKIKAAPLIVVLCAQTHASTQHIDTVIAQEAKDKRYASTQLKNDRMALMHGYIAKLNEHPPQQAQHWLDKQCYIALGNALLAAADMGIDSVAIEGFDRSVIDDTFKLQEKDLHAVVLAGFGYHSPADFNAELPKSRLPEQVLFSEY